MKRKVAHMGMINSIVSSSFKIDEKGRTCFYPYGVLGRGVIISDDNKKNSLFLFLKIYYLFGIATIAVGSILFGWIISLVICLLICLTHWSIISIMIRGLPYSDAILTFKEASSWTSSNSGISITIILFLASTIFTMGCVYIIFQSADQLLIGVMGILFFGTLDLIYGYLLYQKITGRR